MLPIHTCPVPEIHLPLGISFFTFHCISYLFDIYRGEMQPQRNLPRLSLYICLFPQLIAGPIIRYKEIGGQLNARRSIQLRDVSVGLTRFVQGLAKKVLCANILGSFVDQVFALPMNERSPSRRPGSRCWHTDCKSTLISVATAIWPSGLHAILGFLFPENFSHPYIAESVQEFWRRWHMSLSLWFRDYLYVPLGGNQKGTARTALNLALVFFLCGLWHGASWSFIVWGLMHGTMLALRSASLRLRSQSSDYQESCVTPMYWDLCFLRGSHSGPPISRKHGNMRAPCLALNSTEPLPSSVHWSTLRHGLCCLRRFCCACPCGNAQQSPLQA